MTSKEKLIERLNKGFGLEIKQDHPIKTHCNPRGYLGQWSWVFDGCVICPGFGGNIGSCVSITELLKAPQLELEYDDSRSGDWSVWPHKDGEPSRGRTRLVEKI